MQDQPTLSANGIHLPIKEGQSLAATLLTGGIRALRRRRDTGERLGAFCMMGVCQECLVLVDDHLVQACLTESQPGMSVTFDA